MYEEEPWVMHCFRVSETVHAVLKLKNGFNLSPSQIEQLDKEFDELNDNAIPRPGMVMKIPLLNNKEE